MQRVDQVVMVTTWVYNLYPDGTKNILNYTKKGL